MNRNETVQHALTLVYTDFDRYVRDIAREHTVVNMGFELTDVEHYAGPEDLIRSAYQHVLECNAEALGEVEGCDSVEEEFRSWLKDAKRDAARVRKAKLPLTLENARMAFLNRGPFAPVK